jgi:hypothetical protein
MRDDTDLLPLTFIPIGVAALDVVHKIERIGSDYRSSNPTKLSKREFALDSVSFLCFLKSFEALPKNVSAIFEYGSSPPSLIFAHAFNPNLVVGLGFAVSPVQGASANSKIGDTVVSFHAVNVIEHSIRPAPIMESPANAVCVIHLIVYADDPVSESMNPSSLFADMLSAVPALSDPCKNAGLLIIRKQLP